MTDQQQKPPVAFTGNAAELRDSIFLAFEDLDGKGDVTVTIVNVVVHGEVTFKGGKKKENVVGIAFDGKKRQLRMNGEHRDILRTRFGQDTQQWRGQKITIYGDPTVKYGNKVTGGVRIRPVKS